MIKMNFKLLSMYRKKNVQFGKNILTFSLMLFMFGCAVDEKNIDLHRYNLRLVSNANDNDLKELLNHSLVVVQNDSVALLPDNNSNLFILNGRDECQKISLFLDNPCTPTQASAGICDSSIVIEKYNNYLAALNVNCESSMNIDDSLKLKRIYKLIDEFLETGDGKIYIFSLSSQENQLLEPFQEPFSDYKYFYRSIDSLYQTIISDLVSGDKKILVLINPPLKAQARSGRKSPFKSSSEAGVKKEKALISQNSTGLNSTNETSKPKPTPRKLKISTNNKSYFDWTDMGEDFTYNIVFKDYDSKDVVETETSITNNEYSIPNKLVKNRSYEMNLTAKSKSKSNVFKADILFSIDDNGNISQDCKK